MNLFTLINGNKIDFLIEKERKKNKIIGINIHKKDVSINEDKVYSIHNIPASSIEESLEKILELENKKEEIKTKINIEELYELLKGEESGFSLDDLSSYVFIESESIDKIALFELLLQDKIFFKQKNNLFFLKDIDEVKKIQVQLNTTQKRVAKKNQLEEESLKWLKNHLTENKNDLMPDYVEDYLIPVKNFSIYGDEYSKKNKALETLEKISKESGFNIEGNIHFASFKLLKTLGIFSEDENLLLQKHSINTGFKETELNEASELAVNFKLNLSDRIDLRDTFTISIDDQETKDIDDAISLIETDQGYKIMIHIADLSDIIKKNSILDACAFKRTSSIYLPDQKIPMLPPSISEDLCSLLEKKDRYTITYTLETDHDFKILSESIEKTAIRVDKNYSYEKVDKILNSKSEKNYDFFHTLYQLALCFQKKRLDEWGGIEFLFQQVYPRIKNDKIILKYYNTLQSKSNMIVKELMIIINYISAKFLDENDIPGIYIAQDPPEEALPVQTNIITDKITLQEIIKFMKKSYYSTLIKRHYALGLSGYTQITSPIRRYLDLVMQRQITFIITQENTFYSEENLQKIRSEIELLRPVIAEIEDETNKYWLLKYLLKNHRNKLLQITVIRELPDGYIVEVEKTGTSGKLITKKIFDLGDRLKIKFHTILPRLGISLANL